MKNISKKDILKHKKILYEKHIRYILNHKFRLNGDYTAIQLFRTLTNYFQEEGIDFKDAYDNRRKYERISYLCYLKSESWYKFREKIYKERGQKCERCGSTENLQIHHLNYDNLYNEKPEDVMILCSKCHKKEYDNRDNPIIETEGLMGLEKKKRFIIYEIKTGKILKTEKVEGKTSYREVKAKIKEYLEVVKK